MEDVSMKVCDGSEEKKHSECPKSLKGLHLFWASGSPGCWRVRLVLQAKGLPVSLNQISLDKNVQKSPQFLRLNPRGKVPVLIDSGVVVCESQAILSYLEKFYPEASTIPTDRAAAARTLQLTAESDVLLTQACELPYYLRRTPPEKLCEEYHLAKYDELMQELRLWDARLAAGSEPYLAGSAPCLADYAFFPNLAFCVRLHFPLRDYCPNLASYYDRMVKLDIVKATWPPHWKTTEGLPMLADPREEDDDLSDAEADMVTEE